MTNPFDASLATYKLSFDFLYKDLNKIDNVLEPMADAVSSYELFSVQIDPLDTDAWRYEAYFSYVPRCSEVNNALFTATGNNYLLSVEKIEDRDWVEEAQRNFTPIITEDFYISSDYYKNDCPPNKILLSLNPGRAFGTGDHATTQGCIEAMAKLRLLAFSAIADIGCGSGVLAIAAAKYWQGARISGCDIEPIAVEIAGQNAAINQVVADFSSKPALEYLDKLAPQDLILANILAKPLIEIAKPATKAMKQGGYIILSGFLDGQLASVRNAFIACGLKEALVIHKQQWVSLTLQK